MKPTKEQRDLKKKSNPSDKQIREFWEWCGLKVKETENIYHEPITVLQEPNGCSLMVGEPKLDLNNLARYAIPKLMIEYHNWRSVLHDWVDGLTGDCEKDALSLYWLLAQTML